MKEATMVLSAASFIFVVCYLVSRARLASLLRTEARIEGIGIDGVNAQMKLLGVVFLGRHLGPDFAGRHRMLLKLARWSEGVGLLLFLLISASIMLGYAG